MSRVGNAMEAPDVVEVLDGQLPISARQEQFSLAFVRMIVAAAGCSIKSHETDYDGVDITIVSSGEYSRYYLLIPKTPDLWLELDEEGLLTRSRLYWQRASDLGTITEKQGSKTVHLPRSNLFDVAGLLGILQTIGEGCDR